MQVGVLVLWSLKQGNTFFSIKRKQFIDLAKTVFPHQYNDGY